MSNATVTIRGILDMQVCVPKTYTDKQVIIFAEDANPCGTIHGWYIRKKDDKGLHGSPERVQCHDHEENCHIVLEA